METIIEQCINSFDYIYIITVNILTYIIIKIIDFCNGKRAVSVWGKRIVLLASIIIVTIGYILTDYTDYQILFRSAIAAPVGWSWILKPICKKLKIDYKQIDNTLNDKDEDNSDK